MGSCFYHKTAEKLILLHCLILSIITGPFFKQKTSGKSGGFYFQNSKQYSLLIAHYLYFCVQIPVLQVVVNVLQHHSSQGTVYYPVIVRMRHEH